MDILYSYSCQGVTLERGRLLLESSIEEKKGKKEIRQEKREDRFEGDNKVLIFKVSKAKGSSFS